MTTEQSARAPQAEEDAPGERERSTISFPYGDMNDALQIAKGVHSVGGSNCEVDQLAAHLNMAPGGGGFRLKTITAKIFGLTQYSQGTIRLTPLGSRICDPQKEKAAKAEAFLAVPLYRQIYEKFKGVNLPPAAALENEMANMGVAKKQADKARQTFQRAAKQAGFFAYGTDRLVMPAFGAGAALAEPAIGEGQAGGRDDDERPRRGAGAGGGAGGGDTRHALIRGLIETLPDEGSEWEMEARKIWLQGAAAIFSLIYKSGNARTAITIEVKDSAK